jgi:hypothetical protein
VTDPIDLPPGIARRYQALGRLGAGGGGRVFEVLDRLHPNAPSVALKIVRGGPGAIQLAQAEFLLLATLPHPALATVESFGIGEDFAWFTAERIRGSTLSKIALEDRGRLDLRRVAIGLADVLAYLHERKVLHLDLKPSNVLIEDAGRVRLVDLGLSRIAPAARPVSVGTPGYRAPELGSGTAPPGPSADLFALGATLYAAVEGRAFDRAPDAFRSTAWSLDPDLTQEVQWTLAEDPSTRPSAHELRARLARPELELEPPRPSFAGRALPLADLEAAASKEPCVVVEGPPGIGKSRLLRALGQTLEARGQPVLALSGATDIVDKTRAALTYLDTELLILDDAEGLSDSDLAALRTFGLRVVLAGDRVPIADAARIALGPLDRAGTETVLRSVLGRPAPRGAVDRLFAATAGVPGRIRAELETAHRAHQLVLDDSGWRLTG